MPYSSRLNPTQLNNLNLSYIEGVLVKNEDYTIDEGFNHERIKKISNKETSFFVFQAAADSKNKRQRKNLLYINDVIQQFERYTPDREQKMTLLIPLMQCQFWKKHCVLVEVTIEKDQKKINIHDSQSWWRNIFYPNCLKHLKKDGYQVKYSNYKKQADNFSCTYFVYCYIKEILINNVSEGLKNIFVSLNKLKDNDPIGQFIQDNFKQKYPNIRVIESGEFIPWKKSALESYFNIKNSQPFNNPVLNILPHEGDTENYIVINAQANAFKTPLFQPLSLEEKRSSMGQNLTR